MIRRIRANIGGARQAVRNQISRASAPRFGRTARAARRAAPAGAARASGT